MDGLNGFQMNQFMPTQQYVRSASGEHQYTVVPPPGLAMEDPLDIAHLAAQDAAMHTPFLTPSDVEWLPDEGDEVESGVNIGSAQPPRSSNGTESGTAGPSGHSGKVAHKTAAERQAANKNAQQRYRARKKAAESELQAKVAAYDGKLHELQAAKAELERLRLANASLQAEAQRAAHGRSHEEHGDARGPAAEYAQMGRAQFDAVVADLTQVKAELRQLLAQAGLPDDHVGAEAAVPSEAAPRLAQLLQRAAEQQSRLAFIARCQEGGVPMLRDRARLQAGSSEGIDAGLRRKGEAWRARWFDLVTRLRLSTSQSSTLVGARRAVIEKLPAIYEARINLAALVMGTMCPPPSQLAKGPSGLLSSTESKLQTALNWGIGPMQVKAGETMRAMNKLHDNLGEDFQLLLQLQHLLLGEVLTPLQAAVLHIQAGDDPLEALAFCNLVALATGDTFMPPPPIYPPPEDTAAAGVATGAAAKAEPMQTDAAPALPDVR